MTTCGADTTANQLFQTLTADADFPDLPPIDFSSPEWSLPGGETNPIYLPVDKISNCDLTTKIVNGDGTFDWLMASVSAHLKDEYDKGRITGAEYTKAYIALTQAAMSSAVQFLLQKDMAYWQAANAQIAAITAKVGLATAQASYAATLATMMTNQANYALTKMKLATENETVCTAQYNLTTILPQQFENLVKQGVLIQEQTEVQNAQTSDNQLDGVTPVAGVLGKQKLLIQQQITSYMRDAEVKAAKMFADAFSVQKTIDEGIPVPPAFNQDNIDDVMQTIKTNNNL
jgi:hypothetical protein